MLTRKKNLALVVCLLGGAGVTLGAFAPWTSTSVGGLFFYDTACDICSIGEGHRHAVVRFVSTIEDEDQDDVSLVGTIDLGATGATYDKRFPLASVTDPDINLSTAAADNVGEGCAGWNASATVRVETQVKVVASEPKIEVDIWSRSLETENYQARAKVGAGGGFGNSDANASYKILTVDRLEVLVPFSISGAATKIEVRENKITRTQTGHHNDCAGSTCQTLVSWIIWDESMTNCVAHSTNQLDSRNLNQSGDGDTGPGTFTITLPSQVTDYHYVLEVRYRTANALGAAATCGQDSGALELDIEDHFELELEAIE